MYRSTNLIDERKYFVECSRNVFLTHSLYDAIIDANLTAVEYFLSQKNVNPNNLIKDYDAAPLHAAVGIGTEELAVKLVRLLLNFDADPNIQTSEGTTPLMISCLWGRINVAELLVNNGANPFIEDVEKKNSYDHALEIGHEDVRKALKTLTDTYIKNYFQKLYDDCDITSQQYNSLYSDIESDVTCVEFYTLNTGFLVISEDSSSEAESCSYLSPLNETIQKSVDVHCEKQLCKFLSSSETGSDSFLTPLSETIQKSVDVHCEKQSCPISSSSSQVSLISYETDRIKEELKKNHIKHGPITKTTKKVYQNLVKKIKKGQAKNPFVENEFTHFPEILRSTFVTEVEYHILKWTHLEVLMTNNFSNVLTAWRGGKEKQFFTYFLLDPFVTNNLFIRQSNLSELDTWKTFLLSIFYIGKGKNFRPFSHLYEALRKKNKLLNNQKVSRIQNIWSKNAGIVCLHVFHNIMSAEAHTREACMIEALGCNNLTNVQNGEYYGIVRKWSTKEKRQLGLVLLYKALKIYLAEGERQIFPSDLPPLKFH